MAVLPTASESPLVYACEPWVFAMCPALRGSTVSYAEDAHFAKHSLEYSLNFWSPPKNKKKCVSCGKQTHELCGTVDVQHKFHCYMCVGLVRHCVLTGPVVQCAQCTRTAHAHCTTAPGSLLVAFLRP